MKNCILINSYPINNHKIEILYKQILNLKSSNLPIILCSGCDVPEKIYNLVDYIVVNKKKIIKTALYQKQKYLEGKDYVCAYYTNNVVMFNDFVDLTITENIKLLFTLAKFFGFQNVMYAEDDNIFVNANEYIQKNLSILNDSKSKMCAIITEFASNIRGIHTNHFFSNVDFLIANYTFPHDPSLLDNFQNLKPWQMYETSIFRCFESKLNDIHLIDMNERNKYLELKSLFLRDNSIDYITNQRFSLLKFKDNIVRAYIHNTSENLCLTAQLITKNGNNYIEHLNPGVWYVTEPVNFGDTVKIKITDKLSNISLTREITYDSEDKILSLEL